MFFWANIITFSESEFITLYVSDPIFNSLPNEYGFTIGPIISPVLSVVLLIGVATILQEILYKVSVSLAFVCVFLRVNVPVLVLLANRFVDVSKSFITDKKLLLCVHAIVIDASNNLEALVIS